MKCSAAILIAVCTLSTIAQSPAFRAEEIADLIQAELQTARVPGAAIAVVAGGASHARGYGVADTDTGTAMTATTLVHIGSVTKLFTALALAATLEAAKISANTRIGRHVVGLAPRASAATFHQLLSQTSGLRDRSGDYGSDAESALGESVKELTDRDFLLPGDTVFSYSNLGYAAAGRALEILTKRPYAEAMRDVLLIPLGMRDSTLRPADAARAGRAVGHRLEKDAWTIVKPPANDTRIWPAGYMWSNAADMARLLAALMQQGRVDGRQRIPAAAVARVTQPHTPMPNIFVGGHYGYGLMIARDRGVLVYEHGGTLPGFASIVRMAPERGLGIAILGNLDNAPLRRVAQNVMAMALALPSMVPPARTETAVSPDELKPFVGKYRNRGTAELAIRDGRVVLILDEGPAMAVTRLDANRFLARPKPEISGPEFVLEPARGNAPAYLHFALWAFVREP